MDNIAQSEVMPREQAEQLLAQCIAHVFKTIWQNAHLSWKEKRALTIGFIEDLPPSPFNGQVQ
jgi:hypothetical protein